MATYKDLVDVVQGQNESYTQFIIRVYFWADNNYVWAADRLQNESAEDHLRRFGDFEASAWGTYLVDPRDGETSSSQEFILRSNIFYRKKADLYRKCDSEIINSMKQFPNEPLQAWLNRVESILNRYLPVIYNQRFEIFETEDDRIQRILAFSNIRNVIKVKIESEAIEAPIRQALQTSKQKYDSVVELEKGKEKVRLKVRLKDALKLEAIEAEKEAEVKKKNNNKKKHGLFSVIVLCIFMWGCLELSSIITFDWITVVIMGGSILLISVLLGRKSTKTELESNRHYNSIMDKAVQVKKSYEKEGE